MDPNEMLKRIREKVSSIIASEACSDVDLNGVAMDLAVLVNELDDWLSFGGFPPEAWSGGKRRKE